MTGSSASLDWNATDITRRIEDALVVGLGNAGQVLHRRADSLVATNYPPASTPGEPPHRRSGTLQRGLGVRLERIPGGGIVRMGWQRGTPVYAEHLARGTTRMKARPTMPKVLADRQADAVATIVEAVRHELRR